jgi:hypothetical protein
MGPYAGEPKKFVLSVRFDKLVRKHLQEAL